MDAKKFWRIIGVIVGTISVIILLSLVVFNEKQKQVLYGNIERPDYIVLLWVEKQEREYKDYDEFKSEIIAESFRAIPKAKGIDNLLYANGAFISNIVYGATGIRTDINIDSQV